MTRRHLFTAIAAGVTVVLAAITVQLGGAGRDSARFDKVALITKVVYCMNLDVVDDTSSGLPTPSLDDDLSRSYTVRLDCAFKAIPSPDSVAQARVLLDALSEAGRGDDAARSACHDLAHDVGTKAWQSMGSQSLTTDLDSCGYGYYHGAMRGSIDGSDDLVVSVDRLRSFCGDQLAQYPSGDRRQFIAWSLCAHGVGHALGGARTELADGIDLCSPIRTELVDDGDILCATGLLNELSAGGWGSQITTTEQVLERCAAVDNRYKQVCSSYGHFYANIPLDELVLRCNSLPTVYVGGCWEAVGFTATHEVLFTGGDSEGARLLQRPESMARYAENLCADDPRFSCISRFLTELSQLALDPPNLTKVCEALTNKSVSAQCSRAMREMAFVHRV
jgi:hypothetical protein